MLSAKNVSVGCVSSRQVNEHLFYLFLIFVTFYSFFLFIFLGDGGDI